MKLATLATGMTLAFLAGNHFHKPTLTRQGASWQLAHIPMPSCADDHIRRVDIPERDEVDALTVTCEARKEVGR